MNGNLFIVFSAAASGSSDLEEDISAFSCLSASLAAVNSTLNFLNEAASVILPAAVSTPLIIPE